MKSRGRFGTLHRAVKDHERKQTQANMVAAAILAAECGERHDLGSRTDLCPKCQQAAREKR